MANNIAAFGQAGSDKALDLESVIGSLDLTPLDDYTAYFDRRDFWNHVSCYSREVKRLPVKDKQIAKSRNAKNPNAGAVLRLQAERNEISRLVQLQLSIIRRILTKHKIAF